MKRNLCSPLRMLGGVLFLALSLSMVGCMNPTAGGRFQDAIDNLAWTTSTLGHQEDPFGNLAHDLEFFFFTPEFRDLPLTFNLLGW